MGTIDLLIEFERARDEVSQLKMEQKRVHGVHADFNGYYCDAAQPYEFLMDCAEELAFIPECKATLRSIYKHRTCGLFVAVYARKYFWELESQYSSRIEAAIARRKRAIAKLRALHEANGSRW